MNSFSGTIVTLGGGGFSFTGADSAIDDAILRMTGKPRPRVCFVPTASGDDLEYARKFERAFDERAETSVLSLFTKADNDSWTFDPHHVLTQDVIYVGGGSTANLLAVWRLHGLPDLLREAAANGTILAGISAGMNCWYEASSTDSFGPLAPLNDGLGFLPGSACPHLFGEEGRSEKFQVWVADGSLPEGYAADDHVALVWRFSEEYGDLVHAIAERPGRVAQHVTRDANGGIAHVERIPTRLLGDPITPRISAILYDAGLLGMAEFGAPRDEFEPEAEYIAASLADCASADDVAALVHTTFVHCLGPQTAGSASHYVDVARRIAELDH